ncbi:MAG: hypothetical protein ACRCXE_01835, partial [Metamycoplasmataceae bacterium]
MTSNLKKLALGIMSVGGIVVPLAVVASCGSTEKDVNYNITVKTDPTVTQEDIDGDAYKSLATLTKIFNGINASDLANLTVTKEVVGGNNYVITLTAKEGYTIVGQQSLKSVQFTIAVDVEITAKTLVPYEITAEDVDNDAFKSYATLQKLFEFDTAVVTEALLNQAAVVTMSPMTGNQPRKVTLTANKGYALDGEVILLSKEFTIPTNYIITKTSIVPTDIKPSDIVEKKYESFNVLSKLFGGADFSPANIGNLNIELNTIVADEKYSIELTPKVGFHINGTLTGITSDEFTVAIVNLNIVKKTPPSNITSTQIEDPAIIQSKAFLDQLFELGTLTQTDIDNMINVEFNHISGRDYTIKLTSTSIDVKINGQTTYESNQFTIVVNINIAKIDPLMAEVSSFDIAPANLSSLATLKKLFNIDA